MLAKEAALGGNPKIYMFPLSLAKIVRVLFAFGDVSHRRGFIK